jgi:hypothetical protein
VIPSLPSWAEGERRVDIVDRVATEEAFAGLLICGVFLPAFFFLPAISFRLTLFFYQILYVC